MKSFAARHLRQRLLSAGAAILAVNAALVLFTLRPAPELSRANPAGDQPRAAAAAPASPPARFVIQISIDGLGSRWYAPLLAGGTLPNFARLQREGAWTHNARTDFDYTITLPNHTGMLTGRPVDDKLGLAGSGHHWTTNITPLPGVTLHNTAGYYVASAFDVAHDNGLATGLYASKEKFVLFDASYDAGHGAPDAIYPDFGPDKIDTFVNFDLDSARTISDFLRNMAAAPSQYTFVHFNDADTAGHAAGWGGAEYAAAVQSVDAKLGAILALIDASDTLRGRTWIVLSADHGGSALGHSDVTVPAHYSIPMILWGPGIPANTDLYALNGGDTANPGHGRVDNAAGQDQPIRNTDTGNCALRLLGLPVIPGSHSEYLRRACGRPLL